MFYIVTIGSDLKVPSKNIRTEIENNTQFPWYQKNFVFQDTNQLTYSSWKYYYESRNKQCKKEQQLLADEFKDCQESNKDYIVLTTDPVIFTICRLIMKTTRSCGELIVLTKFNNVLKHYDFDKYEINNSGRLPKWPENDNDDIDAPLTSLLSDLL